MNKGDRINLIKQIEKKTDSTVLVYFTGDRPRFETRIGNDVIPKFYEHLSKIGHQEKITLIIYTLGGITNAGFGIVNLIREYCNKFDVIVPFKCYSTGTLIALGANQILMSKVGQLSPIDPSTIHPLGPSIPSNPGLPPKNAPINVEDVMGYFQLAKENGGVRAEDMVKVFNMLADKIHPVVLGAIKRSELQVEYMAKSLLKLHCDDDEKISKMINELLRERFSHQYLITRREAKNIGLSIGDIGSIEDLVMQLYEKYAEFLGLNDSSDPLVLSKNTNQKDTTINQAVIESTTFTDTFSSELSIHPIPVNMQTPPNIQGTEVEISITPNGWTRD